MPRIPTPIESSLPTRVTAQAGNAATLSAIQSELAEIKARMASVETILKAVE
jgi:hypothetical protein